MHSCLTRLPRGPALASPSLAPGADLLPWARSEGLAALQARAQAVVDYLPLCATADNVQNLVGQARRGWAAWLTYNVGLFQRMEI